MNKIKVIIFCGGVGTRLWPMSRKNYPKQFQNLTGNISMFQATLNRLLREFKPEDIYISTGEEYKHFVEEQAIGIPKQNYILEPLRKDTMGAVGLANTFVLDRFPDAIIAAIWGADHIVKDEDLFNKCIKNAASYSGKHNKLVKIDVRPSYPSVHNGWTKVGKKIEEIDSLPIHEFVKFVEKPNEIKAKKMFNSREYLINTGYLVWPAKLMNDLYKKHQPKTYRLLEKIKVELKKNKQEAINKYYPKIEKDSIDYAIFEKLSSNDTVVIPTDIGWTDVGTWELLFDGLASNPKTDNVTKGNTQLIETNRAVVYSNNSDKLISVIGLDDIVIVDTEDGLLVCSLHETSKVKDLVGELKNNNKTKKFT